jgi:hypothetical protein
MTIGYVFATSTGCGEGQRERLPSPRTRLLISRARNRFFKQGEKPEEKETCKDCACAEDREAVDKALRY